MPRRPPALFQPSRPSSPRRRPAPGAAPPCRLLHLALLHEARLREAPWLEANRQMSVSATTKRWVFWCFIVLVLAGGAYVFRGRIVYLFTPAISTLSNIAYYENSAQTWKNTSWL